MSAPTDRKPWPMRWVVLAIVLFLIPYTWLTLKYRKPGRAFEPYEDFKAQANVKRLLEAGFTRATARAERPVPPLARETLFAGPAAAADKAPGGLPGRLSEVLVEAPRLPLAYSGLLAPAETAAGGEMRLQVTARLAGDREQLGGAEVYVHGTSVVVVPVFERVPEGLRARGREGVVLLTLPAGLLPPGRHVVTLAGSEASLRWTVVAR